MAPLRRVLLLLTSLTLCLFDSIPGERSRSGERYRRDEPRRRSRSPARRRSRSGERRRRRTPSPEPLTAEEREALRAEEAIDDLTKDQRTVFVSQLVSPHALCARSVCC